MLLGRVKIIIFEYTIFRTNTYYEMITKYWVLCAVARPAHQAPLHLSYFLFFQQINVLDLLLTEFF